MAITPLTGFKALQFDGEMSTDYGVQILGEGVFDAPKREVQMISIPGRNGAFALDKGRFENIEVTYPANIIADSTADFAEAISDFRNMLCSRRGYCRLTDDYHPDEYRMAVYKEGLEVDEKVLRAGEFDITFDCKPQRWLTSGENAVTVANNGTLTNPTLFDSSPLLAVEGYGTIGFNGYEIELENAVLGDTVIANSGTLSGRKISSYSDNYSANIYLYPEAFNVGDTIIYGDVSLTAVVKMSPPQSATITSIESATSGLAVTAVPDGTGSFDVTLNYTVAGGTFTSGESSAVLVSQSLQTKVNLSDSTSLTRNNTFIISSAWFGNLNPPRENFSFTLQDSTSAKPTALTINYKTIRADSTLSALGHPTYIDCDIGEAYLLNSGVPISLNQHIDLGSDLPKLASGANEITYDNTVTDLKITPRWWKV